MHNDLRKTDIFRVTARGTVAEAAGKLQKGDKVDFKQYSAHDRDARHTARALASALKVNVVVEKRPRDSKSEADFSKHYEATPDWQYLYPAKPEKATSTKGKSSGGRKERVAAGCLSFKDAFARAMALLEGKSGKVALVFTVVDSKRKGEFVEEEYTFDLSSSTYTADVRTAIGVTFDGQIKDVKLKAKTSGRAAASKEAAATPARKPLAKTSAKPVSKTTAAKTPSSRTRKQAA